MMKKEKQNKKRYVVYDGLEGFKTNYKYEVSEAVLDRYYMLLSLNAHDEEGDTLVIDGESYKIQDKVYFWDITEGLIIFLLTDKGIFMDFRQLPESPMKKFTTDDLAHLKECYEKHKAVNPKNLDIFAVYAFWHDGVNHEELEKKYQNVISKQTSLPSTDIPEDTSVLPNSTSIVPAPTPTPTPVEEPKSSVLWIVLGTAAVILLGAVGVLVIRRKK